VCDICNTTVFKIPATICLEEYKTANYMEHSTSQLVKKFVFYGTRRFIIVFTRPILDFFIALHTLQKRIIPIFNLYVIFFFMVGSFMFCFMWNTSTASL